jgi:hypothetical protein
MKRYMLIAGLAALISVAAFSEEAKDAAAAAKPAATEVKAVTAAGEETSGTKALKKQRKHKDGQTSGALEGKKARGEKKAKKDKKAGVAPAQP